MNWNLKEHRECGREFLKRRARDVHMLRPPGRPSWARSWEERTCTCSDHGEDLLGHAPGKKGGRVPGAWLSGEGEAGDRAHGGSVCARPLTTVPLAAAGSPALFSEQWEGFSTWKHLD